MLRLGPVGDSDVVVPLPQIPDEPTSHLAIVEIQAVSSISTVQNQAALDLGTVQRDQIVTSPQEGQNAPLDGRLIHHERVVSRIAVETDSSLDRGFGQSQAVVAFAAMEHDSAFESQIINLHLVISGPHRGHNLARSCDRRSKRNKIGRPPLIVVLLPRTITPEAVSRIVISFAASSPVMISSPSTIAAVTFPASRVRDSSAAIGND